LLKYQGVFVRTFGLPFMAGISRKSMVNRVTGSGPSGSLAGSLAAAVLALQNGATILRVHDVKETVQAVKLFRYYQTIP
jgi:dihydropteroate synthase